MSVGDAVPVVDAPVMIAPMLWSHLLQSWAAELDSATVSEVDGVIRRMRELAADLNHFGQPVLMVKK